METEPKIETIQLNEHGVSPIPCSILGKSSYDIRGQKFTLDSRYRVVKPIGIGAYGVVVSAVDTKDGSMVAWKKIAGVFDDAVDAKRVLREIRLMKALDHENILPLTDMEEPQSIEEFTEVYMASPLYDKDLGKILAANITLTSAHKQYFIYQMLCALKYLHSANVLHRDLKPANILIQESCDLALCDFGLARYVDVDDNMQNGMTEYVVTRWYRAPELVLTHSYTSAVDLWAVGCILGELLGGRVLFKGRDFKHQVETICEIIGKPSEEDAAHVTSSRAQKFLDSLPDHGVTDFQDLFPEADKEGIDLLQKLLRFNPEKRLTAEQALEHPYVSQYHDIDYESKASMEVDMRSLEPRGKHGDVSTEELKQMMIAEIHSFRPNANIFLSCPSLVP